MSRICVLLLATSVFTVAAIGSEGIEKAVNKIGAESKYAVRRLEAAVTKTWSKVAKTALTDMVQTRRLTDTAMCAYGAVGCDLNKAWTDAQVASLTSPEFKSMATKALACEAKVTQTTCAAMVSCAWQGGSCGYQMSEAESMAMMGQVFPTTGCGMMGDIMKAAMNCMSANPCTGNCMSVPSREPSTDAQTCVAGQAQCVMNDANTMNIICPNAGADINAAIQTCSASLMQDIMTAPGCSATTMESAACKQSMVNLMVTCLSKVCANLGTMMQTIMPLTMKCEAIQTETPCGADADCMWEAPGSCKVNDDKTMELMVPAGCQYKATMVEEAKCKGMTQAKCTNAACEWTTRKHCGMTGNPVDHSECDLTGEAAMKVMAEGTDNADMKTFARVAVGEAECKKVTAEADCGTKAAPVFTTRALPGDSLTSAATLANIGFLPLLLVLKAVVN